MRGGVFNWRGWSDARDVEAGLRRGQIDRGSEVWHETIDIKAAND